MRALVAGARGEPVDAEPVIRAVAATLQSNALDPAFKAEAILLPSESLIADRMDVVDPDAIHASREALRAGDRLGARPASCSPRIAATAPRATICRRAPRASGGCARSRWALLAAADDGAGGGAGQGAVRRRRQHDRPPGRARHPGLARRARAAGGARRLLRPLPRRSAGARQMVRAAGGGAAAGHASTRSEACGASATSRMANPNRLRSLAGTFGGNHWAFHARRRPRLRFLADMILAADKLNPQVAARLVPPFGRWRRFEPKRAAMMRAGARADRRHARACRRTCSSRRRRASP